MEAGLGFHVVRGETAELLESADSSLDAVALLVYLFAVFSPHLAAALQLLSVL